MRVAEILSDFDTLRPGVCDTNAAMALVSARSQVDSTSIEQDAVIQRVKDLIELHDKAKRSQRATESQPSGIDQELNAARQAVAGVLSQLQR